MTSDIDKIADFHVRLGRLEQTIAKLTNSARVPNNLLLTGLVGAGATALCILGPGLPNHYYQVMFAVLITALSYHRNWILKSDHWSFWLLLALNCFILSMLLKIFLGGGDPKPLYWVSMPSLEGSMSSLSIKWNESSLAHIALPLSTMQGFIFVLMLFAAAVEFQILASLLAIILICFSLPAVTQFDWSWMLPSFVVGGSYFYLLCGKPVTIDESNDDDRE